MRIILNENNMLGLLTKVIIEGKNTFDGNSDHNPYAKKLNSDKSSLENLLKNDGYIMTNIENGSDYVVYEVVAFANIIGKRYCICQLIKNGEQYGAIYVKPLNTFKIKI